ncbi:transcription factor JUNGBRUNNEN 1-like isoform X1 [Canna indica]|uniref:Transcription factor JUNGBRUNNEN 1-like isoform X1 n=1 Tax=Canna indica TaxID=4628 RepID=A0AAQ3KYI6_9LILI|nr:transcription factor JUNGBRUNNEN 1-like isoform X1 [Canna indica]
MMHEFRLPCSNAGKNPNASMQEAEVWTICRIFKRAASYRNINRRSSTSNNEMPADSGSKTSSFESDGGNEYKLVLSAASYPDQGEMKCVGNGFAVHGNQLWSSNMAQAPPTVTAMQYYSNVEPNAGVNDHFLKLDEDWDELGRVVEFMTTGHNVASYCE